MAVIKQNEVPTSVMAFSMADVEKTAKALIVRARQQADQIIAEARAVAVQLGREAQAKGTEEGKKAGLAAGLAEGKKQGAQQALNEQKAKLAELVAALNKAIAAFDQERGEVEAKAPDEIIALSCSIARRITKRQAEIDPAVLDANVREAMKMVVKANDITLFIHPKQEELLQELLPQLQAIYPCAQHARIEADPKLAPGGCRIITGEGEVDATIDTQLDRIIDEVLPRRED